MASLSSYITNSFSSLDSSATAESVHSLIAKTINAFIINSVTINTKFVGTLSGSPVTGKATFNVISSIKLSVPLDFNNWVTQLQDSLSTKVSPSPLSFDNRSTLKPKPFITSTLQITQSDLKNLPYPETWDYIASKIETLIKSSVGFVFPGTYNSATGTHTIISITM